MMRPLWLDESETFASGIMCVDGYWDVLSLFYDHRENKTNRTTGKI